MNVAPTRQADKGHRLTGQAASTSNQSFASALQSRQTRRANTIVVISLILLGVMWGGSFVLQRLTAASLGAFPLVFVRLALGSGVLAPFLWRARHRINGLLLLKLAGVGLLTSAIPFALFAWGAEQAPAAVGAITNSLTAPFAALVGWCFFQDRIGVMRACGIVVGFCGVLVLVGVDSKHGTSAAAFAGTLASLCYGIGGQLVPRIFPDLPAPAVASATLGTGALIMAAPALLSWPKGSIDWALWSAVAILGTVCTGLAYGLYFWLLTQLGAARAATVTYLIPLFAVLLAWAFLQESPTWKVLAAGAIIITGVVMSQSRTVRPGT